ncbi:MAG: hypothetical protein HKO02_11090 [Hyphomonadaceae bacterium]|nr:hypothetical protein [Hyphomonadaceae bacterium]
MKSQSYPIRRLSAFESNIIPASISAGIDLDAIEIHKRKWTFLTPAYCSVVRGNKIYFPNDPGPSCHPLHLAHLVHEVVHVWQYLHLGISLFHPRWAYDRRYQYQLNPGDRFLSFGWEQQAAIVEDCCRVQHGLPERWAINSPCPDLLAHTIACCDQ